MFVLSNIAFRSLNSFTLLGVSCVFLCQTSTCNAKGDGYNHCCCHVEDPRKEVRDWLKRHRLDGHDSISSLTKKDLLSLVCLKNEAPDFFYQRIWNDLKMKKFSEIENFKAALVDWEEEEED
ncbi:uncharacterized protein [Littorina saxatilis]|uniref:uncharacterized protein n=1 Tax=Littorina saxatilis TaxID=31220 RepID=UPI0038B6696C